MTPLLVLACGLVLLATAGLVLRSYGPRYRVARLLATIAPTPLSEALARARTGPASYLRVDGRIDSEAAFEDAARRPLVFRRTRLQARRWGRWVTFEDSREQVPFEIGDGLAAIDVDSPALDDGLVVIPRISAGHVADLSDRAPGGLPPQAAARAVVDQISAVEHAIVLGVPVLGGNGRPMLTAGLGRPLVLTTLEIPEAMRVIAGGGRTRPSLVAACAVSGLALTAVGAAWAIARVVAGVPG